MHAEKNKIGLFFSLYFLTEECTSYWLVNQDSDQLPAKKKVFPNIACKCPVHIHLAAKFKMDTTKKHGKATEKRA
jgi:hypothetical protein